MLGAPRWREFITARVHPCAGQALHYNSFVAKPSHARVLQAETLGVILIALLILAILLRRWGGHIHWSAR